MIAGVPERDLLREWQAAMQSVVRAVAGGGDVARQVVAPLQRQTELFQEVLEAERRLQREVVGRALAPLDAAFDLLEQSGAALRGQAEAMEHAAQALEQTAVLMKTQAELFEKTIRTLREPSRRLGAAAGVEPRGKSARYEDLSRDQLQKKAAEVGIEGRSKMDKGELIDALRNH